MLPTFDDLHVVAHLEADGDARIDVEVHDVLLGVARVGRRAVAVGLEARTEVEGGGGARAYGRQVRRRVRPVVHVVVAFAPAAAAATARTAAAATRDLGHVFVVYLHHSGTSRRPLLLRQRGVLCTQLTPPSFFFFLQNL